MSSLCEHCGKLFVSKYTLKRHIVLHHVASPLDNSSSHNAASKFWQPWITICEKRNMS